MHLLEDMGVPAHVRNDFLYGHFRSYVFDRGNPFESWVEKQVMVNGNLIPDMYLSSSPQPRVFSKLSDYWDRDLEPNYPLAGLPSVIGD